MQKINKKGFTLLELLGVIVLLGVVALLVATLSNRILGESKESLYETQKEAIIIATKNWAISNNGILPMSETDEAYNLPLTKLAEDGYIENEELIDPRNNKKICGYVKITYNENKNQYKYQMIEETC